VVRIRVEAVSNGTCKAALPPWAHPTGRPRVTWATGRVDRDVVTSPDASVVIIVVTVGGGVMVGNAEALVRAVFCPKSAVYVRFARPDDTMAPTDPATDVLKAKGGVVNEGVGTRKLGNVVWTVAESAERMERTSVVFCCVVEFTSVRSGYKPIKGGSFPFMPKLKIE
jgi:hypothetical protein